MTGEKTDLDDKKVKYLEMIQRVIERMAVESSRMKRFSLISAAAMASTSAAVHAWYLALVSAGILIVFWMMDARYLSQERWYRDLFDQARQPGALADFSLAIPESSKSKHPMTKCAKSWSVAPIYGALILASLIVSATIALERVPAPLDSEAVEE